MDVLEPTRSAYRRWWLGNAIGDVDVFLREAFAETHKGLGLLLGFGSIFFLARGMIEVVGGGFGTWQNDLLFRMVGSVFFALLWLAYRQSRCDRARGTIFAFYMLAYMSATLWWSIEHTMHIGYLAAPLVLCLSVGIIMWPLIGGLYWPALAVVGPTVVMLSSIQAGLRDWVTYGLCFLVAGFFAITMRRTRFHTAVALFVAQENLQEQVDRDPLTGLFNLAGWRAHALALCHRTHSAGTPMSIVFFDIDHFKRVNDEHGHAAGDLVLARVAQALAGSMRQGDVLARMGGEEFVAALPGADIARARAVAERALACVSSLDSNVPVTVSAGVAQLSKSVNLSQAIAQADRGLLLAKRLGRNQVQHSE